MRVLRVSAADDAVQGGDVAAVGGPAGRGEAEPDPLPGIAHGAALCDVTGVGEHGDMLAEGGLGATCGCFVPRTLVDMRAKSSG